MSSDRQAVVRSPSLIGFGYFPDLTPAHHEERLIGIRAGTICFNRNNFFSCFVSI
jgi:arylamine N-acetyltransferase